MLNRAAEFFTPFIPLLVVVALVSLVIWLLHLILDVRRPEFTAKHGFLRQVLTILVIVTGLLMVILVLPVKAETRSDLLALLGITLTAVIALSSTTFVGNIMGGLMLRAVGNFNPGDFVKIGEHFGRVTERGLFHTEIQTEDRELTTLPHLYLVSNPVTVVRSSGTIISAELSLGYDIPHQLVEKLLLKAARSAELSDPFVQIRELGNYAVSYRVAGLTLKIKELLTVRSRLKEEVLDELHRAGCEIVSPSFMNQRALDPHRHILPRQDSSSGKKQDKNGNVPENMIFDKAESAEALEELKKQRDELISEIETLEEKLHEVEGDARGRLKKKIASRRDALKKLVETIEEKRD